MDTIFSKVAFLALCFNRVQDLYDSLDHLPHIIISLSDAKSGVLARADGIAALNEWPENFLAPLPTWRSSRDTTVVVKIFWVRFFPFANWKTGRLKLVEPVLRLARVFRAAKGQKLLFLISKRSTKSPELLRMTLRNLMFTTTKLFFVNFTWFQVSVSDSCSSDFGRISPKQKEPKNATQHAVQKTNLLSWDQLLIAISWPSNFSSGKDILNLDLLEMAEYRDMFFAPFSTALLKKSFSNFASKFLILWAILRSDR